MPAIERLGIHPNQGGGEVRGDHRRLVGGGEHLSAADIQLIFEGEGDRHGRDGSGQIAVEGGDAFHPAGSAGGQSDDAIARPHGAGGDLSGKAAIVLVRADDALDGQAEGSAR